jgi:hypothetical protein
MNIEPYIIDKIKLILRQAKAAGIKYVIIHYVGVANADTSGKAISYYHKKTLGWGTDGYHLFLNDDGNFEDLEPIGKRVNGCRASGRSWYNPWSKTPSNEEYIGEKTLQICFETVKGYDKSYKQDQVLLILFEALRRAIPTILVGGHREFPDYANYNKRQNTICPGYSVSDWLIGNMFPKENCFYEVWKP